MSEDPVTCDDLALESLLHLGEQVQFFIKVALIGELRVQILVLLHCHNNMGWGQVQFL